MILPIRIEYIYLHGKLNDSQNNNATHTVLLFYVFHIQFFFFVF